MGIFELVSAILLVLACIFIVVIIFFQGGNKGGMSQTITGQSSDNYYQRNMGRSKEMRLKRFTTVAAVLFFVVAIAVNLIAARFPDGFGGTATTEPPAQTEEIDNPYDTVEATAENGGETEEPESTPDNANED